MLNRFSGSKFNIDRLEAFCEIKDALYKIDHPRGKTSQNRRSFDSGTISENDGDGKEYKGYSPSVGIPVRLIAKIKTDKYVKHHPRSRVHPKDSENESACFCVFFISLNMDEVYSYKILLLVPSFLSPFFLFYSRFIPNIAEIFMSSMFARYFLFSLFPFSKCA